jgi:uncharacterized protein YbbC (DUF1343 family)
MTHAMLGWWVVLGLVQAPGVDPVRPGLDVLLADSAHLVSGRRVGLVTNQGGIDRAGRHAVERLRAAGIRLTALFSPEHGFRGAAAPGQAVASSVDSATGLPIYILYCASRAPGGAMLDGVDVLLVDLPDVGARYFTYISTTLEVMRAAAARDLPVVVLDRPNPLGGALIQGNVLDPDARSFVGALSVPMRHGLTLGEQALLGNRELGIAARLSVVPAAGWRRQADAFDTALPFVPPSPNLQDPESLFHYPGTCLFEGTALSVGRGTDAAFRQVGAPWLDTAAVLARVRSAGLPGVAFEGVTFTPRAPGDGKYADTTLAGVRLVLRDRAVYDPARAAVALLAAIRAVHPDRIGFLPAGFDRLAGGPALREALEAGSTVEAIVAGWAPALAAFESRRRAVLLYPD